MMLLLSYVHPTVGLAEQLFSVNVVVEEGFTHADREEIGPADFLANFYCDLLQRGDLLLYRLGLQARCDDHELIAAHAGDVVVLARGLAQLLGKTAQHLVAFQVSEAVVYLLEAIEVADQQRECSLGSLAARNFLVEMD